MHVLFLNNFLSQEDSENAKIGNRSKIHKPIKTLYTEEYQTKSEALKCEEQTKG